MASRRDSMAIPYMWVLKRLLVSTDVSGIRVRNCSRHYCIFARNLRGDGEVPAALFFKLQNRILSSISDQTCSTGDRFIFSPPNHHDRIVATASLYAECRNYSRDQPLFNICPFHQRAYGEYCFM